MLCRSCGTWEISCIQRRVRPEVIGALVVAIESDANPFDAIRSRFQEIRGQLQQRLDQVIGGTPVNLADRRGR